MICLRDPMGYAAQPILIGPSGYFIVSLFDGQHSLVDIQAEYANRFGNILTSEKLNELIDVLERGYFLEGEVLSRRIGELRREFAASPRRAAVHAGLCYAAEPRQLREEIAAYFDPPAGPGRRPVSDRPRAPQGLVAPHIDPRRGGPAYAHAYGRLIGCEPPELFIILGTSHYGGGPELFSATTKDYSTPLGEVETDRELVKRLAQHYGQGDLLADELLHRNEHSIEFQALMLAWTLGTRGYQIVPILVSSFHAMVAAGRLPREEPRVAGFVEALGTALEQETRSWCIVAGVDFAHVGRKFGDPRGVDDEFVQWVRREDLALIERIKAGDPEGFFAEIDKDKDRRRICGLAPLYTQLELLQGAAGELLHYDIALEPPTQSAVSFASLSLDRRA